MITEGELISIMVEEKPKFSLLSPENIGLIKKIVNSNPQEREFLLFKLFYDGPNTETIKLMYREMYKHPIKFFNSTSIIGKASYAHSYKIDSINNREVTTEVMSKYNSLLGKMSHLSKELDLNNSLELSILFSYLLWKGYLSKAKENKFESENRKMLQGLFFADIMDGRGVCLNHSEMLKDFLNVCGYASVMLENYYNSNITMTKVLDIERKFANTSHSDSLVKPLFLKMKKINHVFNLIEENEKLYIYDATNLSLLSINNPFSARCINGKVKIKLFPYQSYEFCLSKEDCTLIDKLLTEKISMSPYTKEDFISISEVTTEIIKNSYPLLEDFYTEARSDIMGISEETDKIKARIRTNK